MYIILGKKKRLKRPHKVGRVGGTLRYGSVLYLCLSEWKRLLASRNKIEKIGELTRSASRSGRGAGGGERHSGRSDGHVFVRSNLSGRGGVRAPHDGASPGFRRPAEAVLLHSISTVRAVSGCRWWGGQTTLRAMQFGF